MSLSKFGCFLFFFWTSHCCQAVCCVKFVTKTQVFEWCFFFLAWLTATGVQCKDPETVSPGASTSTTTVLLLAGQVGQVYYRSHIQVGADLRRGILWKATKTRENWPPPFSSNAKYMGQSWRIRPSKLPWVWVGKIMIPEKSARNQITTHPPKDFTGDIRLNPLKWPLFQSWIKAIQPNHLWNIKFWYIWPDQRPRSWQKGHDIGKSQMTPTIILMKFGF